MNSISLSVMVVASLHVYQKTAGQNDTMIKERKHLTKIYGKPQWK